MDWQDVIHINDQPLPYPIVFEVTERQTKKGQRLLFAEYKIDTYWCSLDQLPPEEVIGLYHDHGTSEQFRAELKSDMGLERLPSGHLSSNSLLLHLAALTYNMLRIIGQVTPRDCSSTPAAPLFAFTRLYASHTCLFGISNDFAWVIRSPLTG